ncbi:MAG: NAD(P)-dependent alcohol dehydrogenase [Leptospiraceae bacterium]|nr:NAD(P)-dependent alcohol dehydrogenase [Leptospiraceae bacterium]
MKAIICEAYGPPEVLKLKEIPKPTPKAGEILVKIFATAVNSGDVRVRALRVDGIKRILMKLVLGFSKPRKPILGVVFSGVIESVGEKVQTYKVGDEIFGMTGFQFGTYTEYICLKENSAFCLKPKNASFEEAASILFGGITAYYFLKKAKIDESPKKILIYGAAGSVGIAAVQIAKSFGAEITAVCSGRGIDLVRSLGVKNILDYTKGEFQNLKDSYDIVFDAVGKNLKKDFLHILNSKTVFMTVDGWDVATESVEQLQFIKKLFEDGKLKPTIDKTYNLDEIVEAHRYVDTGKKKGDVVIRIS